MGALSPTSPLASGSRVVHQSCLYIYKKKCWYLVYHGFFCICSDFCKYCITNIILLTTELLSTSSLSHFLPGSLTLPHPSLAAPRGSAQDVLAIVSYCYCRCLLNASYAPGSVVKSFVTIYHLNSNRRKKQKQS